MCNVVVELVRVDAAAIRVVAAAKLAEALLGHRGCGRVCGCVCAKWDVVFESRGSQSSFWVMTQRDHALGFGAECAALSLIGRKAVAGG